MARGSSGAEWHEVSEADDPAQTVRPHRQRRSFECSRHPDPASRRTRQRHRLPPDQPARRRDPTHRGQVVPRFRHRTLHRPRRRLARLGLDRRASPGGARRPRRRQRPRSRSTAPKCRSWTGRRPPSWPRSTRSGLRDALGVAPLPQDPEAGPRRARPLLLRTAPGRAAASRSTSRSIIPSPAIGRQRKTLDLSPAAFRREISRARTFGLLRDVERLWKLGFALGSSLENSVAVDGDRILNPEGLRSSDEFVSPQDARRGGRPRPGGRADHRPLPRLLPRPQDELPGAPGAVRGPHGLQLRRGPGPRSPRASPISAVSRRCRPSPPRSTDPTHRMRAEHGTLRSSSRAAIVADLQQLGFFGEWRRGAGNKALFPPPDGPIASTPRTAFPGRRAAMPSSADRAFTMVSDRFRMAIRTAPPGGPAGRSPGGLLGVRFDQPLRCRREIRDQDPGRDAGRRHLQPGPRPPAEEGRRRRRQEVRRTRQAVPVLGLVAEGSHDADLRQYQAGDYDDRDRDRQALSTSCTRTRRTRPMPCICRRCPTTSRSPTCRATRPMPPRRSICSSRS